MKKVLAIVLTLALMLSMSTVAVAAAEINMNGGTNTGTVTVNVANADPVYSVLVKWESLQFTYDKTWNPKTHAYSGWDKTTASITVENHSNAAVKYSAKFGDSDTAEASGVTATLNNNSNITVLTADQDAYRNAENKSPIDATYLAGPKAEITVEVSNAPTETETFTVGTITLTISAV